MHELTVAIQICRALEAELGSEDDAIVADVVHVQVGALSGVVPEALQFAWPHATADSPVLASAQLHIDRIDVELHCTTCNEVCVVSDIASMRCPSCRSPDVEVIAGDELDIAGVDIRDRAQGPA